MNPRKSARSRRPDDPAERALSYRPAYELGLERQTLIPERLERRAGGLVVVGSVFLAQHGIGEEIGMDFFPIVPDRAVSPALLELFLGPGVVEPLGDGPSEIALLRRDEPEIVQRL